MCFEELIQRYKSINAKLERVISDPQHDTGETIHSLDIELTEVIEHILHYNPEDKQRVHRIKFCLEIIQNQYFLYGSDTNSYIDSIRSDCEFLLNKLESQAAT